MRMNKIKIVIVDDSPFVREGLKIIFELDNDFELIGCAENGKEAVSIDSQNEVDIYLMDIQMPVMDGIEATRIISAKGKSKVLILTTFDDDDLIMEALKMGAKGYLIKNHPPEKIKQMVKIVHYGGSILEEAILEKIAKNSIDKPVKTQFDSNIFTERELEIIMLISQGYSNKNIADNLFISEGTIKNYISAILDKTQLAHRTQIAIYYLTGKKTN
jgi:DNA-binding NarL/FixJ family response regulator